MCIRDRNEASVLENVDFADGEGILHARVMQRDALELGWGERSRNGEAPVSYTHLYLTKAAKKRTYGSSLPHS